MPEYAQTAAEVFAQARSCYQDAEQWLARPEAAALTHAELEDQLTVRGRALLRLMLQGQPSATSGSSAAPRRNDSISSISAGRTGQSCPSSVSLVNGAGTTLLMQITRGRDND